MGTVNLGADPDTLKRMGPAGLSQKRGGGARTLFTIFLSILHMKKKKQNKTKRKQTISQ